MDDDDGLSPSHNAQQTNKQKQLRNTQPFNIYPLLDGGRKGSPELRKLRLSRSLDITSVVIFLFFVDPFPQRSANGFPWSFSFGSRRVIQCNKSCRWGSHHDQGHQVVLHKLMPFYLKKFQ